MMNHTKKFDLMAIVDFLKRMDGWDFVPTKFQKWRSNGLGCFVNISKYMTNQQLIFGVPSVLDILNVINGSNPNCGKKKVSKSKANNSLISL